MRGPDVGRTSFPLHGGRGGSTQLSEFANSMASSQINTLWNNLPILESEERFIFVNSNHLFSKVRVQRI